MAERVSDRHLVGLLGTAGKAIAAMPEGKRVIQQLRLAKGPEDLLFVLRSADLSLADPARDVITRAAAKDWQETRATLLKSAELQHAERYSANA